MTPADSKLIRIARQHLQTSLLQGVGFVPVRARPTSLETETSDESGVLIEARAHVASSAAGTVATGAVQPEFGETLLIRAPVSARPRKQGDAATKAGLLQDLRARHDKTCPHCTAVTYHTQTVFGEGDSNARLMFIGEAPGEEEDRTGRPFVGRAGQKLNDIFKAMGLSREEVYIANILKSRPPDNRTPLQPEIDACAPFLTDQIRIIEPLVIVALGGPSAKYLLRTDTGITRLRGQWGSFQDGDVDVPVMPTFHPAYLLRAYTPDNRRKVWSDVQMVLDRLNES